VNAHSLLCRCQRRDIVHVAFGYGLFTGGLGLHFVVKAQGGDRGSCLRGQPRRPETLLADLGATGLAGTP
jgi:phenylacetate-CoA ligase